MIRRVLSFAGFGVLLLAWSRYLTDSAWNTGDELHTLTESVGTALVAFVAALSLVRYYSEKNPTFFFIGLAFGATAFMDGYHTIVTSDFFLEQYVLSIQRNGWVWFANRTYLGLLLWLSWLFWKREQRLGTAGKVSENTIYAIVIVLALASLALIELAPLPTAIREPDLIPRPQQFVPAAFFLLALSGYLRKGQWRADPFEYWLVLALVASFAGEAFFMAFSRQAYDPMFVAAHLLELVSYLCAVIGLLFNLSRLYSESRAQKELAFKNVLLATQQEVSRDAILVVDRKGRIVSYNQRFAGMAGVPNEVLEAGHVRPVLRAVAAQTLNPQAFAARATHLHAHPTEESTEETEFRDGRTFECYSAPMTGPHGANYGRIWFYRDVTDRKRAERAVLQEKAFADKIVASLPDTFCVFDVNGRYLRWNNRLQELLGLSQHQMAHADVFATIVEEDRPLVMQKVRETVNQGAATAEARVCALRGQREYSFSAVPLQTTQGVHVIAIGTDITERKQAERDVLALQEQMRAQALRDPLTGLYNRRALSDAMPRELERARRSGTQVGLIICDIDFFKKVNDTYGHLGGDEVLKVVGKLLSSHARGSDIVCRFGGEEFLLVLTEVPAAVTLERAAQIRRELQATAITAGRSVIHVTASFGVAMFPEHGTTLDELLRCADGAMYQAKTDGRNRVAMAGARSIQAADAPEGRSA